MDESVDDEIGAQLRVHACEEILVECRRQAERIVVREQELAFRLDQVGAEQQVVARMDGCADLAEKRRRAWRIEVADVRSEQHDQNRDGSCLGLSWRKWDAASAKSRRSSCRSRSARVSMVHWLAGAPATVSLRHRDSDCCMTCSPAPLTIVLVGTFGSGCGGRPQAERRRHGHEIGQ
jgi:hypothetical protein